MRYLLRGTLAIATVFLSMLLAMVASGKVSFAQGTGIGTLPRTGAQRNVGWLDPWATISIEAQSGARFTLASAHDLEDSILGTPPASPEVMHATWRWHGATITLDVPRLGSEVGDEGYARFCERFARQVATAQSRMPPDGTLVLMLERAFWARDPWSAQAA